ncbi:MAG TPA: energy transducer TonB [Vibrio sp.]|uniref:energy transducer TonB n=1 Tax=Pseudomonas sp. C27(2019) TaxID=2604941 RepID=UPI000E7F70DE|nr:energy transducer TonB [Pseudomonas sp. C27(2019)]QEY59949.1 energy transducer TonB [Pseudomonas sp. C27(2019)]HAS63755.1 energy transducer TonB [Vibrio sp.]
MKNSASNPFTEPKPAVSASDRLGFTLLIAALLHLAIILGVGFTTSDLPELSKSLDVTLATFKSEKEPEKADFIAQDSQQGSGTLEEAAVPKTTEKAPFQDTEVKKVQVESSIEPTPVTPEVKKVISTTQPQKQKVVSQPKEQPKPKPTRKIPVIDREQLSADIASLEAELAFEQQQYAKRPRVSRQNTAATKRDISAWYRDAWRKKVERVGNLNYPEEARRKGIYGSLRVLVIIKSDGSLETMRILESSGHPVLDKAALNIVRTSAPFAHFTGELAANYDQVEIIRTWRFERGDRLSSQ